jgi:hypothetical protein
MTETIAPPGSGTVARAIDTCTIDQQLTLCRQTLQCAALALAQAEDEGFEGDEGPAAIRVVERCVEDLQQIEQSLDRLEMRLRNETALPEPERIF